MHINQDSDPLAVIRSASKNMLLASQNEAFLEAYTKIIRLEADNESKEYVFLF